MCLPQCLALTLSLDIFPTRACSNSRLSMFFKRREVVCIPVLTSCCVQRRSVQRPEHAGRGRQRQNDKGYQGSIFLGIAPCLLRLYGCVPRKGCNFLPLRVDMRRSREAHGNDTHLLCDIHVMVLGES